MHRHDTDPVSVVLRLGCVFPSRDEKDVDSRAANADRLLFDAADGGHAPVELQLSGGCDAPTVVDVLAELLEHVERKREPGRRAADASGTDLDVERKLDERRLVDEDADDRSTRSLRIGNR